MNNRKKHVLNKAHELFIEKGFHATSIQEILDRSGISKGTFYNYFTSKNELLISIFQNIYSEVGEKRRKLIRGQDKTDIEVLIKQIELLIKTNEQLKIISLFEEILFTNDQELKEFLKIRRMEELNWLYNRLLDICTFDKEPYLLDCAIMLTGILHNNFFFYGLENKDMKDVHKIVKYSVNRIMHMIDDLSKTKEQLLEPKLLKKWLPDHYSTDKHIDNDLEGTIQELKKSILLSCVNKTEQGKYEELIDFIQEEVKKVSPRVYLIESILDTLNESLNKGICQKAYNTFEERILLIMAN
ncbi:MAG: TetR/AcrR family transcriptional regulator [Bacillus sp. (in: firmicutes)]